MALARAVINRPKILLLDEPLSALDPSLRKHLREELVEMQKTLGITFLFVTHDQEEAMSLSDRMAIMKNGLILECSSPEEIYENPKSLYTANFIGIANIIEIYKKGENFYSDDLGINFKLNKELKNIKTNILLRPEKIKIQSINNSKISSLNSFIGEILEKSYLGSFTRYEIKIKNKIISVLDQNFNSNSNYNFPKGEKVICSWESESIKVLED